MKNKSDKPKEGTSKEPFPGYPQYSSDEDIFNKEKQEGLSDEDVPEIIKEGGKKPALDEGLDVPGADLDDQDELTGEEDEENNYYSLGGDDHDDLEEDVED